MGNEVIGLEDEAHHLVAEGIPFRIFEIVGGFSIDQKISGGVMIESPDDVEEGRFPATGGA
jgi:hypothetical protein